MRQLQLTSEYREKISKINEQTTKYLQDKFNKNNLRIIEVLESQEENSYKEATNKYIIAKKYPELKSACVHLHTGHPSSTS